MWRLYCVLLLGIALNGSSLEAQVVFEPIIADQLVTLYEKVQVEGRKEFAFCLSGVVRGGTTHVHGFTMIKTDSATNTSVWFTGGLTIGCRGVRNLLGLGHSHPPGSPCEFSDTDWKTYNHFIYRMGFVLCEKEMLTTYTRSPQMASH